ncbi:MAG: tetratricopeptide repeat protein, partial [Myxococcota bacterium]|nr:tetratricopeptide repeat protein [Myxococcota bacterium]
AKIYEAMGDVGALSQLLGLYIDGNLENPRGYELQFEVGIWSGNPKMAASAVEGLYLVPGREPMALALAARYNGMGQPAKSVEFIRASGVDLTEASLAPVLDVMVENLIASGQVDAALEQASVALEKTPLYWKLHEIQGRALLAYDSKLAEAQLAFEEALRLNPRNPEALKGLAVSLSRQGQVDEALVLYRQAGEIDWLSPEAEWAAIDLLTEQGRIGERDALLEILVQEHGEDARGAALLAQRLLDEGGDLVRARGLAERAVEMRGGESAQAVLSQIEARESGPGQGSTEG